MQRGENPNLTKESYLMCFIKKNLGFFSLHFFIILFFPVLNCEANDKQPPPMGNFALPISQQPGPLIGFGQNIISKK